MNDTELQQLRGRVMHVLGDVQTLIRHIDNLAGAIPVDRRPMPIAQLRQQRGWSLQMLADEAELAAQRCRYRLPDRPILLSMLSGWESGLAPDTFYRELLNTVFAQKTPISSGHEVKVA